MLKQKSTENHIRNYSLFTKELHELPATSKTLVHTINQYSYCLASKDLAFRKSLMEADVLLPDGVAIVAAVWLLTGKKIKKIAGANLHQHLMEEMDRKGGRCFYLGTSDSTLQIIAERSRREYPNIKVSGYSPPFKEEFTMEESDQMIAAVNAFHPDVLFIGMTAPKQEKWAFAHKEFLDVKVICCIGAVFDFYAGTIERPGQVWINCGLEWLVRLVREPRRMWVRYLYYGPIFIKDLLLEKANRMLM
ncbi:MAG: WecB/TagA/CpsF family glycosyltransferase [Cyclobacteriaceae bacterium]